MINFNFKQLRLLMKIFISLLLLSLSSCADAENTDAKELCKCYTQLHRANKETQVSRISDSCGKLYTNILIKHKNDKASLAAFKEAYNNCQ